MVQGCHGDQPADDHVGVDPGRRLESAGRDTTTRQEGHPIRVRLPPASVVPSRHENVLSDMTLSKLVMEQGIVPAPDAVGSHARGWAPEEPDHPREVIEAALAHVV